jgi:predicted ribosomally synthesized peptide with SipW-like signal peptide
MLKKLTGLSIVVLLLLGVTVSATWAYFRDTEASSSNQFTTGRLDLKTNGADGVSVTLSNTSLKPNNSVTGTTITLSNSGNLNGATLNISFSYVESDGDQYGTTNMTADQVASVLQVTTLTYDTANFISGVGAPNGAVTDANGNGNGWLDVQDLTYAANVAKLTGCSGLTAGGSKAFNITVFLRDGISNDYQGDGITITMTFTLHQ